MARATGGGEAAAEWGGVRSSGGGGGFGGGGGKSGRGGDESRGAHGRKFIGEGDNAGREGEMYRSEVEVRSNEEGGVVASGELWSWAASPEGSSRAVESGRWRHEESARSLGSDVVPKIFWNGVNPNIGGIF
jgi:hypothetical protein